MLHLKISLLLLILALLPGISKSQGLGEDKPNIIFIMADDLGYGDLGCYGQKLMQTPHLDKLAAEGIRFTQAYAGGPVCTPSRCVLMTGLHNGHGAARDNVPHYRTYLKADDITIAELLKSAGYRCGGFGKWSLGDPGTEGKATQQGFDEWFGYLNQDHAHYYYPEYLDDSEQKEHDCRLDLSGNTLQRKHYSHDLIADRALEFIKKSKGQPFFLYAAFTLPHFSSSNEDADRFTVPSTFPYTPKNWDAQSKKYAAMVHMIDRDVGRIVKLVDDMGLSKNTLIIFTSDNGGHDVIWDELDTNGPLRGHKRDLTEGGIRVPFIVKWEGKTPQGRISDEIIAFQDMLPSFAELAQTKMPANIDGISVVNALTGNKQLKKHEYLYWDYGHCRTRYDQAIRMGKWKGIRQGIKSELQVYNLDEDLGEENNLAGEYPDIVQKLNELLDEAYEPNELYPIGEIYTGKPIWQKEVLQKK
jgi:arylsulfatase A-like enzyme